jgi:predicted metal-dependent hydrolase
VCTPLSAISRVLTTHDAWLARAVQSLGVSGVVDPERVRAEYLAHRESARALVTRELERINEHYGFVYGRVSIRNTTSRWGSCSSKKNLNFSYRVLFLPAHLREYVLVHELCHLREMNHGPAFWALVAETIPDYRVRRRAVRGASLAPTGATTHTS